MRIVWGLVLLCFSQYLWAEVQLEGVRVGTTADRTRVVLDLSEPVQHHVFLLSEPYRLVVDLKDTAFTGALDQPGPGEPYLRGLRGARRDGSDYRVVLDLKKLADNHNFLLKPANGHGHRLVIDLFAMGTQPIAGSENDAPAPISDKEPAGTQEVATVDIEPVAVAANQATEEEAEVVPDEIAEVPETSDPQVAAVMDPPARQTSGRAMSGESSGAFHPGLDLTLGYDDNLLRSIPGTERDTLVYNIVPSLTYESQDNKHRFLASWDLDAGFYAASSLDNYVDNTVGAELELTPTSRARLGVSGEYKDTHDPRGTGRAEGIAIGRPDLEPDAWHHFKVEGNAGYGLEEAKARVEGDVGYISKRYDNNRTLTATRDRDDTYGSGRMFFRMGPKTEMLVEGRVTHYAYNFTAPFTSSLDSDTYQILGGFTWEALNKTTGTVKVGYINKDFYSANRVDGDAVNWEVDVQWRPRTYSVVNLSTSRQFLETNGAGNFIQRDSFTVDWTHDWGNLVSTTADFSYSNDSFDPTTREDDLINAGVQMNYAVRRWLTLSAGYRYDERDSNRNAFDYERNLFLVTAGMAF